VTLGREFFARSVHEVGPGLIGCTLLVDGVGGPIVEVEAYDHEDPASHGFRGETARGLEPTHRVDEMRARRGFDAPHLLASGPGRLCQALAVTGEHDGLPLDRPPFELLAREAEPEIVTGPRIGITRAAELPWRYGLAGSPYLSRSFPASARRPA
jgi:DNA-3-methyladenine glycosylase